MSGTPSFDGPLSSPRSFNSLSMIGDESWPTSIAVGDSEHGDPSPLRRRPRFGLSPLSSPRSFNPSSSEVRNPQDDTGIFGLLGPSSMHGPSFRGAELPSWRLPLLPVAPEDIEADNTSDAIASGAFVNIREDIPDDISE